MKGSNTKGDLKSGLTEKSKITQKKTRGETTGQRPVPDKENCKGPYRFKS